MQLLFQLWAADGVLIALLGDEAAYGGADQLLLVLRKEMLLRSGLRIRIFFYRGIRIRHFQNVSVMESGS